MKKAALFSLILLACAGVFAQNGMTHKGQMATGQQAEALQAPPKKLARKIGKLTGAPLQISKNILIPASTKQVFAFVSNHEELPKLLPMIHEVKVDQSNAKVKNGVGCVRTCTMADGNALSEEIVLWQPGKAYAYAIADGNMMGLESHVGVMTVSRAGNQTRLSWYQYFDHQNPEMVKPQIDPLMDMILMKIHGHFTAEVAGR